MDDIQTLVADAIAAMQEATDDADTLAGYALTRLHEAGYVITYRPSRWCGGKSDGTVTPTREAE